MSKREGELLCGEYVRSRRGLRPNEVLVTIRFVSEDHFSPHLSRHHIASQVTGGGSVAYRRVERSLDQCRWRVGRLVVETLT